jgi:hypothetical protein
MATPRRQLEFCAVRRDVSVRMRRGERDAKEQVA